MDGNRMIGFSKVELGGDMPLPMAGFAGVRRASGTHDPLYAKCLVYSEHGQLFALVSLDMISVGYLLCGAVRGALATLGIEKDNTALFATHTHSAPAGASDTEHGELKGFGNVFGQLDAGFVASVADACRRAAEQAIKNLDAYTLSSFESHVDGVGSNRTNPSLAGDPMLTGFIFEQSGGKRCLLYNYACHPTILTADNTLRTADLPGAVAAKLTAFDEVIFINGSCGDISTRFTRRGFGFGELDRFAETVACAINTGSASAAICREQGISQLLCPVTLKTKTPLPVDEINAKAEKYIKQLEQAKADGADAAALRSISAYIEGAAASRFYSENYCGNTEYELDCRILTVGGRRICCCPGELFSELANPLKAKMGVLFAGYANGYFLYIADKKAYDDSCYEACSSPFARGEGERLIAHYEKALEPTTPRCEQPVR